MTTNVPLPNFTPAGLVVPTEPQILTGVQADWVAAFASSGRQLNTALTTPQGQLAQSEAYMLSQLYAGYLQLINGVDPATADGAFQDALGRIYRLTRKPATYATVNATVAGVVGTVLPAGSLARSTDGSIWATTTAVTFNSAGSAPVVFKAQVAGSGPTVGVNGLSIYQARNGWETVTNATPNVPGADTESRQSFEERRTASVSIGGTGNAQAVRAAVADVADVSDVFVYNNGSGNPLLYGATNYPVPANSVAISVSGGDDQLIAEAILSKLSGGCGYPDSPGVGTLTSVIVEDTEGYSEPYPQYDVRFVRPLPVEVYARVEVAQLSSLPSTYVGDVQNAVAQAIIDGFTTTDGSITVQRARIGGQIVSARYFPVVIALGNITPIAITFGFTPDPATGELLTLGIDQVPVCDPLNITVEAVPV